MDRMGIFNCLFFLILTILISCYFFPLLKFNKKSQLTNVLFFVKV